MDQKMGPHYQSYQNKRYDLHTKSIPSPVIKIGDEVIAFAARHKFLGILLDAPGLVWQDHLQFLRDKSIPKVNLIKSM
jgi:hypothetical protein